MKIANLNHKSNQLLLGIEQLIEQTGRNVAVYLNTEISRLYWSIGNYFVTELQYETYSQHGQQILATLSQHLTKKVWQRLYLHRLDTNDKSCRSLR
jgi:hypothetical protein